MRMPMNPVSRITSRMSVKGTRGKEFHSLAPSAQRTFLLAGRRVAARASVAPRTASAVRRVIVNDVTPLACRMPLLRPLSSIRLQAREGGAGEAFGGRGDHGGIAETKDRYHQVVALAANDVQLRACVGDLQQARRHSHAIDDSGRGPG